MNPTHAVELEHHKPSGQYYLKLNGYTIAIVEDELLAFGGASHLRKAIRAVGGNATLIDHTATKEDV